MLTIEYRMRYPMQGKSYDIDSDVRNELHHEIAKGVKYIIDRRDSKWSMNFQLF